MTTHPAGAPGTAPAAAPTSAPAEKAKAEKKEPKEKKAKAEKPAKETVARPRLPKHPDDHVITVLKPGSKARGAAERFTRYVTGMTVRAYLNKIKEDFDRTEGQTMADIRWDEDHKFIHVGPTVVDVPAPPAPAPAQAPAAPAAAPAAPTS